MTQARSGEGPVPAPRSPAVHPAADTIRLSSDELFAGTRKIVIMHGAHEYRLRITKGDKLILTK